jgi:prepilin-type N-terminal cleavage/methylation domain-containing protein
MASEPIDRAAQRGFTLIEVMIAVGITAMVMITVHMTFIGTLQASVEMESLAEDKEPGPRILAMLERDIDGLWHTNIQKNRVLRGRNLDIAGSPADRIDFLTTTDATSVVLDGQGNPRRAGLCEVGYWLRQNPDNPQLLELWRREDPMIDDNLLVEGQFQLVHDRLKSFNLKYYATLGYEAEEINEWDSSVEDTLPRRILVELTLERKVANRNRSSGAEVGDEGPVERTYTRHIVLDPRYPDILKAGVALMPVRPRKPAANAGGGLGPAGGGGAGNFGQNVIGGKGGDGSTTVVEGIRPGGTGPGQPGGRRRGGGNNARGGSNPIPPPGRGGNGGGNAGGINIGDLLRGGGGGGGGRGGGLFGGGQGGGGRR